MPNIGPMELAIVVIIALVIFGPKKLPELGSSLGRGMREFKSSISGDDDEHTREEASVRRLESTSREGDESPVRTEPKPTPVAVKPADA